MPAGVGGGEDHDDPGTDEAGDAGVVGDLVGGPVGSGARPQVTMKRLIRVITKAIEMMANGTASEAS